MELQKKLKKILLPALKIAIGSSAAIGIAEFLSLQYASSAGIIALLTIASTKWETMRLSLYRLITFCITVILTFLLFHLLPWDWATYGLFLLFTVIYSTWIGWRVTISVNEMCIRDRSFCDPSGNLRIVPAHRVILLFRS